MPLRSPGHSALPVSGSRAPVSPDALGKLWLDQAPDGILCTDSEGQITYGNACICGLLGYTLPEFIRLDLSDTYDPAEAHLANARLQAAVTGELSICERRMRRKDGTFVPVEIKYVRLNNGSFVGVARDITAWKHREQRMLAQLSTLRILGKASSLAQATPGLLHALAECLGWDYGGCWEPEPATGILHCRCVWQRQPARTARFAAASQAMFLRPGEGAIGLVAASAEAHWFPDITRDASFLRGADAMHDGLRSTCAFPLRAGGQLVAVIELLSHELRSLEEETMQTLREIADQVTAFIESPARGRR